MTHWSCKMNVMSVGQDSSSLPGNTTVNSSPVSNRLRASSSLRVFPGLFFWLFQRYVYMGVESGFFIFRFLCVLQIIGLGPFWVEGNIEGVGRGVFLCYFPLGVVG